VSELAVSFDEMTVLSEGGADVFLVNLNDTEETPPYYIAVNGRRFSFEGLTFLIQGHSAVMPAWVRENEAEGRLVILGERDDRYLRYVYDPQAELEEDEDDAEEAAAS
jgi:hypothetical protein